MGIIFSECLSLLFVFVFWFFVRAVGLFGALCAALGLCLIDLSTIYYYSMLCMC